MNKISGAKRVRDLFAKARAKQPAIIFIDEIDAIGGKRNARDQQYMKQVKKNMTFVVKIIYLSS